MDYAAILRQGSSETQNLPPTILIYAEGGVGKTTTAGKAPDVAFLCTEVGAHNIKGITRFPDKGCIPTWEALLGYVAAFANGEHSFKSLVLDTADVAAVLCFNKLVAESGKGSYEKMPYGKEDALALKFRELLMGLEKCRNRGMLVIVLAHASVRKVNNASIGEYYQYTGKMQKDLWAVLYNWVDIAMFARKEMAIYQPDKGKAMGMVDGARYLYAESDTGFEAKQRAGYSLPKQMPLDFDALMEALRAGDEKPEMVRDRIDALLAEIANEEIATKAKVFVTQAGADVVKLRGVENGLKVKLNDMKNKEKAA